MLWTLVVILVVIWLLAMAGSYTMSGFIYVLPILAVITLIIQLVTGRRRAP